MTISIRTFSSPKKSCRSRQLRPALIVGAIAASQPVPASHGLQFCCCTQVRALRGVCCYCSRLPGLCSGVSSALVATGDVENRCLLAPLLGRTNAACVLRCPEAFDPITSRPMRYVLLETRSRDRLGDHLGLRDGHLGDGAILQPLGSIKL
jgi:hypothetical protein